MEEYQPPQSFNPAGTVINNPAGELPFDIDDTPLQNSANPVKSGGVFEALAEKEDALPQSPETKPEEYFLDGTKNWRSLIDKVVELYEAVREERWQVVWDDIAGKPSDLILEESDPTVPDWVKNLTEEQTEALAWLTANFPRTGLTPGAVLIVGADGETITQKSFGEMLSVFFPGLSAILSGVVSAPTSVTAAQKSYDVEIVWADIERTVGYYAVEVRAKVEGVWGDWGLINQDDYTQKSHLWTKENIPAGTTDVGARVRYINSANQASAWTAGQTSYDAEEEVITETTYEIVPGSGRWWTDGNTITPPAEEGETTYEIVAGSGRWWSADSITPPDPTKPNPPVISVLRLNANTIDVKVADTNSGKADTFEFNYREIGTSAWYTLKNDGSLNVSSASPLLVNQATNNNTWNLTLSITNALFSGKKIEARVRTYVALVASNWSTVVQEPNAGGSNRVMSVRTAKINIQKIDGLWTDTESDTESGKLAYYYVNGRPLKNSDGSRKRFEDMSYRAGLLITVGKVFLDMAFFNSFTDFEDTFWMAMIGTSNEGKIGDYALHHFITY